MNAINEEIALDPPRQLADARPIRRRNVWTIVKGERIVRTVVPHQHNLSFVPFVVDVPETVSRSQIGFVEYHSFRFWGILAEGQIPTVAFKASSGASEVARFLMRFDYNKAVVEGAVGARYTSLARFS